MRTPVYSLDEMQDLYVAEEVARVGIVPSSDKDPIGFQFTLAGQRFAVIGYATREEFLEAVVRAGVESPESFEQCPMNMYFLRVSTD